MMKVSEREREKEKRVVPHMVMPGKNRKIYSEGHIKSIKRLKTDISTIKDESMNSKFGKMPEGQQVIYPSTYTSIYIYIYTFCFVCINYKFCKQNCDHNIETEKPQKERNEKAGGEREGGKSSDTGVSFYTHTHVYIIIIFQWGVCYAI